MSSSVSFRMGGRMHMSISGSNLSHETLNRGPLVLLLRRHNEFTSEINKVQFSFIFSKYVLRMLLNYTLFLVKFSGFELYLRLQIRNSYLKFEVSVKYLLHENFLTHL